jgi:hypothetical protein
MMRPQKVGALSLSGMGEVFSVELQRRLTARSVGDRKGMSKVVSLGNGIRKSCENDSKNSLARSTHLHWLDPPAFL